MQDKGFAKQSFQVEENDMRLSVGMLLCDHE